MNTLSSIRERIRAQKCENSYPQLERMYPGVNRYFFWMLVNRDDYEPPPSICKRLGITKYPQRNRIAVNLDDPQSAAATLRAHASPEFVAALVRELTE